MPPKRVMLWIAVVVTGLGSLYFFPFFRWSIRASTQDDAARAISYGWGAIIIAAITCVSLVAAGSVAFWMRQRRTAAFIVGMSLTYLLPCANVGSRGGAEAPIFRYGAIGIAILCSLASLGFVLIALRERPQRPYNRRHRNPR